MNLSGIKYSLAYFLSKPQKIIILHHILLRISRLGNLYHICYNKNNTLTQFGEIIIMDNPREKWDLIWELMEASILLGREGERLPTQPTIENFQKAYNRRRDALAKVVQHFDILGATDKN